MMVGGEDEGVPATAIREVCLLKELKHSNIVSLYDVLFEPPKMTLIFEYCEYDLKKYMERNGNKTKAALRSEARQVMKQVLLALRYMHHRHVVHRDLKPENIFININRGAKETGNGALGAAVSHGPENEGSRSQGVIINGGEKRGLGDGGVNGTDSSNPDGNDALQLVAKLGDYGLARVENIPVKKYSHDVVSLWYRSPDVMMGSALYGFAVDMWSVGCIFAEIVTRKPLLKGRTDVEQLIKIFQLLGTPTPETWPSMLSYPKCKKLIDAATKIVREQIGSLSQDAKRKVQTQQRKQQQQQQQQQQQANQAQGLPRYKEQPSNIVARGDEVSPAGHPVRPLNDDSTANGNGASEAHRNGYNLPSELLFQSTFDDYVEKSRFREIAGEEGVDLLRKLLCYEPSYRLTAQEALSHPFLRKLKPSV
ncbi:protein kinase, putative [Trypanosoma cruzi marinkellei]|uniref:Protein kinase, putative n=1 Tax=Trypanosoma cruzi marinkellei TaxID=85056 RepID=K2NAI7_TRYCR|nr:protein kinase, putative [Trypanosoma cruzi marinkellei]